ncbi:uncharacterized protein LOC119629673 isoform X2 [Bombyx mori]|uniref:Uncharacterized protein n=1 Tax=Bombyx mori TaxID=7091 RepID=A0A8R2M2B1_BOMMO|nr:uncharacterized protein LOC119629673 isoform X2 [Bombyx mori]
MAPSPEYDKEPKAPDKSATCVSSDDTKVLHNLVTDQQTNSDLKPMNSIGNSDVENNKHVETLDDGQLRALLDEAITYKCPKDREGKSSLFKELLEEVEQDEQACEAAARCTGGGRGSRRGARARPPLPHSNSLQDLVAALAAEPTSRRHHARHAAHVPATASVSARAIHGGSLPSGVDTSSLLCEEPARGAGYLATVRCVNPPPLAERRVSASDANSPHEMESLNRRSKPMFPMTYTARATLEIGSGSVSSGRAVTTTTASNQVGLGGARAGTPPDEPGRNMRRPYRDAAVGAGPRGPDSSSADWLRWVDSWYEGLAAYAASHEMVGRPQRRNSSHEIHDDKESKIKYNSFLKFHSSQDFQSYDGGQSSKATPDECDQVPRAKTTNINCDCFCENIKDANSKSVTRFKNGCRERLGKDLVMPNLSAINPRNVRVMTISAPSAVENVKSNENEKSCNSYKKSSHKIIEVKDNNESTLEKEIDKTITFTSKDSKSLTISGTTDDIPSKNEINSLDKTLSCTKINVYSKDSRKQEDVYDESLSDQCMNTKETHDIKQSTNLLCSISKDNISAVEKAPPKNSYENISKNKTCSLDKEEFEKIYNENNLVSLLGDEIKSPSIKSSSLVEVPKEISQERTEVIQTVDVDLTVDVKQSTDDYCDKEGSELALVNYDNYLTPNEVCYEILEVIDCKTVDIVTENGIEMVVIPSNVNLDDEYLKSNFTQYMDNQQKLMDALKAESNIVKETNASTSVVEDINKDIPEHSVITDAECKEKTVQEIKIDLTINKCTEIACIEKVSNNNNDDEIDNKELAIIQNRNSDRKPVEKFTITDFPYNAYIFLTQPTLLASLNNNNEKLQIQDIIKSTNIKPYVSENAATKANKKKKEKPRPGNVNLKKDALIHKNALKVLLFEDLSHDDDRNDETESGKYGQATDNDKEVDSAIPFSCITTPEVVSGCNTTPSASQSAAAADPKPRGVISSAFNGLPLSRPNYGSTASTASDEHKKSLDENGNAVQAFSSPLAGSGQHKKPRRKKSSKNETVIDCRQIDGYQGDKDVNELLRFIESDAESARPKLGRAKHRDDNDDKAAKKRSTERRKDKDHKAKRASSLEELSRTTLEELTGPRADPAPKPERRSWGETRDDPDPDPVPVGELTDFQTVTKRRKPRRRLDEQPRRRHEPPAPPSDHTGPNDSGDELESAHSPPPAAPPAPPPASYADIARTRHNIPDLIESCNYYAEGEEEGERVAEPPTLPADIKPGTGSVRPRRDGKAANAKRGKDRSPPAPDVVADRRPAVILLDAGARPPDMDGVTFGFDVNEQLVGGGGRRVDLLPGAAGAARGAGGVAVRAGALLVRYVPPPPPADTHHLLQIVDYVGNAWEEVVRCGGGKVRYYSE